MDLTTPYTVAPAYLPVDSSVPSQVSHVTSAAALRAVASALRGVIELLESAPHAPAEAAAHLTVLDSILRTAADLLSHELSPLSGPDELRSSEAATLAQARIEQERGDLIEDPPNYVIYDEYFRVRRVPQMTGPQFTAQMLRSFSMVAVDLPYAPLAMDELVAMLKAMLVCISCIRIESDDELPVDMPAILTIRSAEADDIAGYWFFSGLSPAATALRSHAVATYRWIIGHHVFDLFSIFCGRELEQISAAMSHPNGSLSNAEFARRVDNGTVLLRGTTAAMWYAACFPLRCYLNDVRLQMISTHAPDGFSGNQNADYERMKTRKTRLFGTGRVAPTQKNADLGSAGAYYVKDGRWQARNDTDLTALRAVLRFLETDVEDGEHHVILAGARVGLEAAAISDQDRYDKRKAGSLAAKPLSAVVQLRNFVVEPRRVLLNAFTRYLSEDKRGVVSE